MWLEGREQLKSNLLNLGRQELAFETKIRELLRIAREEGRAGNFAESDAAWELREQLVAAFAKLQTEITQIERVLYTARTCKR